MNKPIGAVMLAVNLCTVTDPADPGLFVAGLIACVFSLLIILKD